MDSFRFMASMAADSALESLSSAQDRAKAAAAEMAAAGASVGSDGFTTMASGLTSGVDRVRAAGDSMASIDLSKLEAGSIVSACSSLTQAAKESVRSTVEAGSSSLQALPRTSRLHRAFEF